jgi:ParB family transcriptional regulator, chromosome partitioning protein
VAETVEARAIPVAAVSPNPDQPRTRPDDEDELDELAASIREHGLLQPLVVSERADGRFELIAGERRWRAARRAGLATVPAVVKEATPRSRLELALVENIQRRDLNPLEEAQAYRHLLDEHGLTQEELGRRVGKSRTVVTNRLRLLQLPEPARRALAEGAISDGHGRALLMLDGAADRLALLDAVLAEGLSVRQTEARARRLAAARPAKRGRGARRVRHDPDQARLVDEFCSALGTKVDLQRTRHGGRLVIHFFSDDELQGLYDAIVGAPAARGPGGQWSGFGHRPSDTDRRPPTADPASGAS